MEKIDIRAVEMTRRIRAMHSEQLRDATPEERREFYRQKAQRLNAEVEALRQAKRAVASGPSFSGLS